MIEPKPRKQKSRRLWLIPVVIVGLLATVIVVGILATAPGRQEIMQMPIDQVDFSNLQDGTYTGRYTGQADHFRDTTVKVTVSDGKVTDIEPGNTANLVKDGKPIEVRPGQTIFDLYDRVIQARSLQVDVISGATLTSKTHLKAVEDAVGQAQK